MFANGTHWNDPAAEHIRQLRMEADGCRLAKQARRAGVSEELPRVRVRVPWTSRLARRLAV